MADEVATPTRLDKLFCLDYFRNQVPWYGPYINDGRHYIIVSSSLSGWPSAVDYDLTCWIFDETGSIVSMKPLLQKQRAVEPVTINLKEETAELSPMRGMVALLLRPSEPGVAVPTVEQTWAVRICDDSGINELVASGTSKTINFPERTGRKGKFRLFSSALMICEGWRSIAVIMNASANSEYTTDLNLRVHAFNKKGKRLDVSGIRVPPFGTVWLDMLELFGDRLLQLLSDSDGRGSYAIESDDAASIGYHFLYHPETGKFAGDHTRPLMAYIPNCYGAGVFTLKKPSYRDFLSHGKFLCSQIFKR
jgi:hypothetical protein